MACWSATSTRSTRFCPVIIPIRPSNSKFSAIASCKPSRSRWRNRNRKPRNPPRRSDNNDQSDKKDGPEEETRHETDVLFHWTEVIARFFCHFVALSPCRLIICKGGRPRRTARKSHQSRRAQDRALRGADRDAGR